MSESPRPISIRAAAKKDLPLVLQFIRELAEYEKEAGAVVATEESLERSLFSSPPKAYCLIAFYGQEPAGFAVYFFNFSTWLAQPGLYLEDLFVHPHLRKKGVASALLQQLAQIALKEGCGRFEWAALNWNTLATGFYKNLGARPLEEWTTFRVEGDSIRRIAEK